MKLSDFNKVYFLGIGGIGMSALARWFRHSGLSIAGYDKTETPLTKALVAEGMDLHYADSVSNIPTEVVSDKEHTLVIFTPAIPADHKEHAYLKAEGYTILKRSQVLGLITRQYRTIAVAGTHGKTTTSSMIAHILKHANVSMVGFLGGITANYGSNLVMNGTVGSDTIAVVEADEFDRSFLQLYPEIAIVTSADADHLDIYGDHQQVIDSFNAFIGQISRAGKLIINTKAMEVLGTPTDIQYTEYSMSRGQFFAGSITTTGGFFEFDVLGDETIGHIRLGVPGFHNVENALAAILAARQVGISPVVIREALESFKGVKRRFEFIYRGKSHVYIDDYAHHPAEIEAFLTSVRALYPGRKLTAIFQPHLFSRTRDFASGFASSLSIADEVVLLEIYPARELPIPGVDAGIVFKDITSPVKIRTTKESLISHITGMDIDVLVTIGAGDIDTFVEPIRNLLIEKYEA